MISGAGKSKSPLPRRLSLSTPHHSFSPKLLGTKPLPTESQSPEQAGLPQGPARVDDPAALPECPQPLPQDSSEDHCPVSRDDPHQGTLPNRIGLQEPLSAPRGTSLPSSRFCLDCGDGPYMVRRASFNPKASGTLGTRGQRGKGSRNPGGPQK